MSLVVVVAVGAAVDCDNYLRQHYWLRCLSPKTPMMRTSPLLRRLLAAMCNCDGPAVMLVYNWCYYFVIAVVGYCL